MTTKTALSILREDTKREAERLKARNGVLACHARTLNAVHRKLLKVHATTPGANNFRLYAYSCGFAHYVYFQLDIDKLASLKDDVLIKALTRIEVAAGVEFATHGTTTTARCPRASSQRTRCWSTTRAPRSTLKCPCRLRWPPRARGAAV